MDIFSNPTAYAAPVLDDDDVEDPLADLGRDSYAQSAAGEEQTTSYENGFFYEAPEVIEQTQKIQKESGAYGLYYDVDTPAQGNYYEPAAGNSYTYGAHDDDDSASLSDEVKDFRTKIQKPLSSAIQDFAKSYYWNERFQALLERPTFTPKEIALRQADIDHFVQEFVLVAKPVCEQIVKEISVPVEKKQVKPIAAGGIAGGEKYLHKDLFLKFARDHIQIQLYGGDEWAQKAAFHELKSLSALISCSVPNLHFPMMCLVKCYGHCLVVVSKLPLSGNTLIYGSANAAVDIKTDNYDMETMLKQVTQTLNLKPHQVLETRTKMLKTLYGPVDIEGHQGLDGRYYVVDTARLFPPATPIAKVKGCHLYKLLRPELVKANPVPLSSDAFSSFGRPNQKEHNDEAREATRRVLADIIPNKLARNKGFLVRSIKDELHSYGVNVRYLGSVYAHSKDRTHANYDRDVHLVLLIELIARAFKGVLFSEWRKIESDIPTRSKVVAVKYFNLLLGQGPNVNNFWTSSLKDAVVKRFIFYPETESTDDYEKHIQYATSVLEPNMHNTICQSQGCKVKLFERAIALTGVEFSKAAMTEIGRIFDTFFNSPQPFKQGDVANIQLLAKYIEVKPFMDVLRANFEEAEKFYLDELKSRREILGDDHMQLALTHINLGDLYSEKNKKEQAEEQYNLALKIMKTVDADQVDVADLREKRADFFFKFDMLDKAESELNTVINLKIKYLKEKGFTQDSLAVAALKDKLARVFTKQQRFQEAKTVLEEVIRIKQAKFDHFHWQVAKSLNNLAQVMFAQKEYSKAEPICQNVLDILIRQRGPEHSEVGIALDNLAKIYAATGRRERAQKLLEQAKDIKIKAFGDTHTYVGITLDHLASNLLATVTNNYPNKETILEECKNYYEKALSIFKATYGDLHAALGITNNNLGLLHLKLHKYDEALGYFEKAHQIFMDTIGPTSPQTVAAQNNIQLIKQSSPDVLDTLTFEQAYHSGEMYADASEKPVDESAQLDDATAELIRELGFDPSQFTKTQAAQILEMLNSIQTTETPTPEPDQPQGYSTIDESEEYEGSSDGDQSDSDSSASDGGYVSGTHEDDPAPQRAPEPAPVKRTFSDVEPYAYEAVPGQTTSLASEIENAINTTTNRQDSLQELNEMTTQERKLAFNKKKSSSRFFDSFKAGVRNAFSFWKSKDKKSDKKSDKQAQQDGSSRSIPADVALERQSLSNVNNQSLTIANEAATFQGYSYAEAEKKIVPENASLEGYSAYSDTAYIESEEEEDWDETVPTQDTAQVRRASIDGHFAEGAADDQDYTQSTQLDSLARQSTTEQKDISGYDAYSAAYEATEEFMPSPRTPVVLVPMSAPIKPITPYDMASLDDEMPGATDTPVPDDEKRDESKIDDGVPALTPQNDKQDTTVQAPPPPPPGLGSPFVFPGSMEPQSLSTGPGIPLPPGLGAPFLGSTATPFSLPGSGIPPPVPGYGAPPRPGSKGPPPPPGSRAPPSPRSTEVAIPPPPRKQAPELMATNAAALSRPVTPITRPTSAVSANNAPLSMQSVGGAPTGEQTAVQPHSTKGRFKVTTTTSSLSSSQPTSDVARPATESLTKSARGGATLTSPRSSRSAPGGSGPSTPNKTPSNTNIAAAPKTPIGRLAKTQPAVAREPKTEQLEMLAEAEARAKREETERKNQEAGNRQRGEEEKEQKAEPAKQAEPLGGALRKKKTISQPSPASKTEISSRRDVMPSPIAGKTEKKVLAKEMPQKPIKSADKDKEKDIKKKDEDKSKKKEKKENKEKKERKESGKSVKKGSSPGGITNTNKKEKDDDYIEEEFEKEKVKRNRKTSLLYNPPTELKADDSNFKVLDSSFYTESVPAKPAMPTKSKKPQVMSKKAMPKPQLQQSQASSQQSQQQQQTPAALLNNLSEQQKEDLRKRLQQLAGSSRQVPTQQQTQQQQAPQQLQQQAPQQQQAPALMQFNWTNI